MAYVAPTSATTTTRASGTGAWANPSAILVSDDSQATYAPLTPGLKTAYLIALGFVCPSSTPVGVTTFRVERQADPDDTGVSLVVSDTVQLLLSGSPIGPNLSHGEGLPDMDAIEEYTVDLSALGVIASDLTAGNLSLRLGWKHSVLDPSVYDPANWSFNLAPSSTSVQPDGYPGPYGGTNVFHLVATWIGVGAPPPIVPIQIHATSNASGPYSVPGSVVLDNGIGAHVTGTIPNPPVTGVGPADSTRTFLLSVGGDGKARKTVTLFRSNTGNPGDTPDFGMGAVVPSMGVLPTATALCDSVMALFPDPGGGSSTTTTSYVPSKTVHIPALPIKDF